LLDKLLLCLSLQPSEQPFPSRQPPSRAYLRLGLWLQIFARRLTGLKEGFQFVNRPAFPIVCLLQERPTLLGTKGSRPAAQRRNSAISAHVFHDGTPQLGEV
jgi:hypothetical protein